MSNSPAGIHLQNIVLDESFTPTQKVDCLKVMKVFIKNLTDPIKVQQVDDKYRQINLSNDKIQKKLVSISLSIEYLKCIGFKKIEEENFLRIDKDIINIPTMQTSLSEIMTAIDMIMPNNNLNNNTATATSMTTTMSRSSSFNEEKKVDDDGNNNNYKRSNSSISNTSSTSSNYVGKMSEKQKARILMEEKQRKEKEEAKRIRKENIAKLKQDKYVRQNDENWTSGVSAAADKQGDTIMRFRDRYGE